MPTLQLYLFRFRDPLTGKWVRARYKLQVPELHRCYAQWGTTDAPDVRHVSAATPEQFSPVGVPAPTRTEYRVIWTGRPVREI